MQSTRKRSIRIAEGKKALVAENASHKSYMGILMLVTSGKCHFLLILLPSALKKQWLYMENSDDRTSTMLVNYYESV